MNFAPLNNAFPADATSSRCPTSSIPSRTCAAPSTAKPGAAVLERLRSGASWSGLAIYDAGSRCFYNVRRPVHEPADLHGLKIRVPPSDIFIALMRRARRQPDAAAVRRSLLGAADAPDRRRREQLAHVPHQPPVRSRALLVADRAFVLARSAADVAAQLTMRCRRAIARSCCDGCARDRCRTCATLWDKHGSRVARSRARRRRARPTKSTCAAFRSAARRARALSSQTRDLRELYRRHSRARLMALRMSHAPSDTTCARLCTAGARRDRRSPAWRSSAWRRSQALAGVRALRAERLAELDRAARAAVA